MYNIRKAQDSDEAAIRAILDELDLVYPGIVLQDFWVVENQAWIIAVGRMEEIGDMLFLSSFGVRELHRRRGVAKQLFETMIENDSRDVYIYTVIPEFFEKLGFVRTNKPDHLPEREQFGCEWCELERCVCMVRSKHVS